MELARDIPDEPVAAPVDQYPGGIGVQGRGAVVGRRAVVHSGGGPAPREVRRQALGEQIEDEFVGPRFMIFLANLDMHPLDAADRIAAIRDDFGSGYCNITKCCTDVCPEHINITDNGIIPLKERVVDRFYDPIARLLRGRSKRQTAPALDPDAR